MLSIFVIIVFFIVLAILANPYIGKGNGVVGEDFDEDRGVSINRRSITGRSLCDPIDQNFFDDF